MRHCLRDSTFSCLSRTPACDRQTDKQTDGHMKTAYTALGALRDKNENGPTHLHVQQVNPIMRGSLLSGWSVVVSSTTVLNNELQWAELLSRGPGHYGVIMPCSINRAAADQQLLVVGRGIN